MKLSARVARPLCALFCLSFAFESALVEFDGHSSVALVHFHSPFRFTHLTPPLSSVRDCVRVCECYHCTRGNRFIDIRKTPECGNEMKTEERRRARLPCQNAKSFVSKVNKINFLRLSSNGFISSSFFSAHHISATLAVLWAVSVVHFHIIIWRYRSSHSHESHSMFASNYWLFDECNFEAISSSCDDSRRLPRNHIVLPSLLPWINCSWWECVCAVFTVFPVEDCYKRSLIMHNASLQIAVRCEWDGWLTRCEKL